MVRFAVLGTGFWSQFQIGAWQDIEGVELVAVYNRTVEKAQRTAERFHVPRVYSDPEELFRKEQLDFVDIITEVPGHAPLVHLAAKHRVPVICQKPMAPDYATCVGMVEACEQAGVPFFIHENVRWQAPIRAVSRVLRSGVIGKPYRARIQLTHGTVEQVEKQPILKTLEHWALTDMGSHCLDVARFLFGEAKSLYCLILKTGRVPGARGEDVASVMLDMGGMICHCLLGWTGDYIQIEGMLGTLEMTPDYRLITETADGRTVEQVTWPSYSWADPEYGPYHPSIIECNRNLLQGVTGRGPAETTGRDNLRTMRLVYGAYESAAQGQAIVIE